MAVPKTEAQRAAVGDDPKTPKHRSPNHPVVDLKKAVERVGVLHKAYGMHAVPFSTFCKAFGYKQNSSGAAQLLASLKAYGLVNIDGMGDGRKIAVSQVADRIVRNAPDRDALVRAAALTPQIHKDVWKHYEAEGALPHNDILHQYLVWDRPAGSRFAEDAVRGFISRLRSTLNYAKITQADKTDAETQDPVDENDDPPPSPGDKARLSPVVPPVKNGSVVIRDFPIPLMSGGIAVVQVPFPMTEADFNQLSATLKAWKPALTRTTTQEQNASSGDDDETERLLNEDHDMADDEDQ